jgi:hypothetical protein
MSVNEKEIELYGNGYVDLVKISISIEIGLYNNHNHVYKRICRPWIVRLLELLSGCFRYNYDILILTPNS